MMDITYLDMVKICISFICGACLGLEREYFSKPAGFRTMIMITIGATVFTIFSYRISPNNPDRIAANIITGIGFIGAGVIFKEGLKVGGVTTAATIWIAAAVGMAIGFGAFYLAAIVTFLVLVTLAILSRLESFMDKFHQVKIYKISYLSTSYSSQQFENQLLKLNIRFRRYKEMKNQLEICQFYKIDASQIKFEQLNAFLMQSEQIVGFEF